MLDRRALLLTSAAAGLAGCAGARPPATSAPARGEAARLNTLLEQFAQEVLAEAPESRTALGLDKGEFAAAKYRLDDRSDEAVGRRLAQLDNRLARLRRINRQALSGRDAVNYDTVAYSFESDANLGRFRRQDYVVNQLSGVYQSVPDFLDTQHSIESRADAEAYLSRLQAFAKNIDQETQRLNLSAAAGTIAPDFIIDKTLVQMRALRNTPAAETVMVTSIARRTREKNIAGDWAAQATRIVSGEIRPALDRQLASLNRLRPRAVHDAGVWRLRDGEAYYAAALQNQTTTKMTPDEVHELGRSIARDLTARADTLLRSQGMTQGSVAQRIAALGRDSRHIYPNTEPGKAELLRDLNEQIRVLNTKLPQVFATLPKAAVEVRRVPTYIEAGAPGGYYDQPTLDGSRPGAYYINLRDTAEWPRWSLPTLTYHEASPGHHLQIALMLEDQNSPLLRKMTFFNAYIEGWALYAEQLAQEIGMYEGDPLGEVGYLQSALFRAGRLVVDTGLHHKRWSRERAIREFVDITGDQESALTTEIERYAVWPGQALGYMVGKTEWLRLREGARARLGSRFDIRGFHDAGLLSGAMPLTVLERVIEDWTRTQAA
jgi:uncharacterized protein (DUF885 family)